MPAGYEVENRNRDGAVQGTTWRLLRPALFCLAALLYGLYFLHLSADFPNHSPWMDWAKYTDEGWYGDAAIRYYLRGTWRLPGDFNPGAALPVWPLLESAVFHFTGVGIVAARALIIAVLGGSLACGYAVVCLPDREQTTSAQRSLYALAGVLLLCANPFVYAFGRMAILEPLLVFFTLCALLVAWSVRHAHNGARLLRLMALGLLAATMVGTKTTAVFILPSLCWMLWDSDGWRLRVCLRDTCVAVAALAVPIAVYLVLLRRHGLLADARYLFAANGYTGITRQTFWPVLGQTLGSAAWTGPIVYGAAAVPVLLILFRRSAWRDAVFTACALWAAGYLGYIAFHANFQPRYYFVVAVPLTLLVVRGAAHLTAWNRLVPVVLLPVGVCLFLRDVRETLRYVRHPEYTFQQAARQVQSLVLAEPHHAQTVLSISGSNLSLMTGLPSICDDFGTLDLADRIAAYKPGWFVTWNFVEDDKMDALSRSYRLTRMASVAAMDDPDRNQLIVYRLDPKQARRRDHGQER